MRTYYVSIFEASAYLGFMLYIKAKCSVEGNVSQHSISYTKLSRHIRIYSYKFTGIVITYSKYSRSLRVRNSVVGLLFVIQLMQVHLVIDPQSQQLLRYI